MIFYYDLTSLLVLSLTSAVLAAPIHNNNVTNASLVMNDSPSLSVAGSQLDSSPPCPDGAVMSSNSSCMPVGMVKRANEGSLGSPPSTTLLPRDEPSHILLSRSTPQADDPRVQLQQELNGLLGEQIIKQTLLQVLLARRSVILQPLQRAREQGGQTAEELQRGIRQLGQLKQELLQSLDKIQSPE